MGRLSIKNLLKTGLDRDMDTLLYWRTLLVNSIVLVGLGVSTTLIFINFYNQLYLHAALNGISIFLLLVVYWLNSTKRYLLASLYFINLSTLFIAVASLAAYDQNRFTETENLLYFFLVMALFLLDKKMAQFEFWFITIVIVVLKLVKNDSQNLALDQNFAFILVNVSVLVIALYSFSSLFIRFLKKSLSEIQKQQNIFYSLIDNIPLYIGIYDEKGYYTMVNKNYEKAFFMKREEIIGKRLRDIIPEKNISIYEPMLNKALAGEEVEFHEKTRMKDGSLIMANGKYVPIFDEDGQVTSVTVSLVDVTKLETMRTELEQANQAKDRMLSIVSHDIRNPLSNFEALLEASGENVITKDEFEEFSRKLLTQLAPIKNTINELLEWSRLQLNGMIPQPDLVDTSGVLKEVLDTLKSNLTEKQITLAISGTALSLYVDHTHLKIVLRNLLGNAIKFTPIKGKITVKHSSSKSLGIIEVSDSGAGISDALIEKILNGNLVESSSGTMGEKGTGLGLNVCVELIENNNGELKIMNLETGGAQFTVSFPLTK